ncbi:hypothetical protein Plhal710r2_c021g0089601 [Plasmopara halstedii]
MVAFVTTSYASFNYGTSISKVFEDSRPISYIRAKRAKHIANYLTTDDEQSFMVPAVQLRSFNHLSVHDVNAMASLGRDCISTPALGSDIIKMVDILRLIRKNRLYSK